MHRKKMICFNQNEPKIELVDTNLNMLNALVLYSINQYFGIRSVQMHV